MQLSTFIYSSRALVDICIKVFKMLYYQGLLIDLVYVLLSATRGSQILSGYIAIYSQTSMARTPLGPWKIVHG